MAGAHPVDWEQPPRYPREVIQFTDSVQHNFWAMLISRAYSHFGELIGVWRRLEEVKLQAAQDRETEQAKL